MRLQHVLKRISILGGCAHCALRVRMLPCCVLRVCSCAARVLVCCCCAGPRHMVQGKARGRASSGAGSCSSKWTSCEVCARWCVGAECRVLRWPRSGTRHGQGAGRVAAQHAHAPGLAVAGHAAVFGWQLARVFCALRATRDAMAAVHGRLFTMSIIFRFQAPSGRKPTAGILALRKTSTKRGSPCGTTRTCRGAPLWA